MPNKKKRVCTKPVLDITDVAKQWDQCPVVRDRLRETKMVINGPACQDISTCVCFRGILVPLLERMALLEHRPVPNIDPLKEEVLSLFQMHKLATDTALIDDDNLAKTAWAIRKLCGFVKSKVRRQEVSTATRLQFACRAWNYHHRIFFREMSTKTILTYA